MFMFDESPNTLFTRCSGLGIDLEAHVDAGTIDIVQIDPGRAVAG